MLDKQLMVKNCAYQALEDIGWGRYSWRVYIICGLAWAVFEIWYMAIAYVLQGISLEWGVDSLQLGIIGSFFPLGLLIGSFIWGFISDTYGRSPASKYSAVFALISSLLLLISISKYMVALSFCLIGIGIAAEISLGGTILYENSPPSKRFYITSLSFFFCTSDCLISLVAYLISIINTSRFHDWRLIVLYGVVFEAMMLVTKLCFLKETPAFYCSIGELKSAEYILNEISMKNRGIAFSFEGDDQELWKPINSESVDNKRKEGLKYLLHELFNSSLLKTTILFCAVIYIQAYFSEGFSLAGFTYFTPEFLSEFSLNETYMIMFIERTSGFPAVLFSIYLVESCFGRKYTVCIWFTIAGICCGVFLLNQSPVYIIAIIGFFNFAIYIAYSALFTIVAESFPTHVRGIGVGLANIFARLGGISAPVITGVLLKYNFGKKLILLIFCGLFTVSGICVSLLVETRKIT